MTDDPLGISQNRLFTIEEVYRLLENDPALPTTRAAAYLGVRPATMDVWRWRRIGPPWTKLESGAVRYRLSALNAHLLMREEQTTRLPALGKGRFPVIGKGIKTRRRPRAQKIGPAAVAD